MGEQCRDCRNVRVGSMTEQSSEGVMERNMIEGVGFMSSGKAL
jgi:hypothetical protein